MKCLLFLAFFVAFSAVQSFKPYKSFEEYFADEAQNMKKLEYYYKVEHEKTLSKLLESGLPIEHEDVQREISLYKAFKNAKNKSVFTPLPFLLGGLNGESQNWDNVADGVNDFWREIDEVYSKRKN